MLGRKIRSLRQRLSRTLHETASAAGLSKPFLSQVERGHASPSLASLARISTALGVTAQYFLDSPSEECSITRGDRLQYVFATDSGSLLGSLTNRSRGRELEAVLVRTPAGQGHCPVTAHAGEEFIYVLDGRISLALEDASFELRAGDSAHYASSMPHSWANLGNRESLVVWVALPRPL